MEKITCSVEGCENSRQYKEFCQNHYRRWKRNGDPTVVIPLGRKRVAGSTDHRKLDPEVKMANKLARTLNTCRRGHVLSEENTYVYPEGSVLAGKRVCKVCRANSQRVYRKLQPIERSTVSTWNRDKTQCPHGHEYSEKNTHYRSDGSRSCIACRAENIRDRKYGLNRAAFNELKATQEDSCAICKISFTEAILHVDHDHKTEAVRGLLCGNCNTGLGQFKDSVEVLQSAIRYLERYRIS